MSKLENNDTFTVKNQTDLEQVLQRLKDFANDQGYVKPQFLSEREKNKASQRNISDCPDKDSQRIKIDYL